MLVRVAGPARSAYDSIVVDSNSVEVVAASALLSTIADPIRWQLIAQLAAVDTLCVCNLRTDPEIPGNLLSYHLKVLREAGLIEGTRRGRWVDYRLAEGALERLHSALPAPSPVAACGCRQPVSMGAR